MSVTAHFALVPRDGLFCKDGRGWHTSASGRGHGLDWPWPSTVLGAVRSAWGCAEEARTGKRFERDTWRSGTAGVSLGRTLVLRRPPDAPWTGLHRVWPVPSDALGLQGRGDVHRLDPVPPCLPTLGRDDDEAREALWVPRLDEAAKPLPPPRWWSDSRFTRWLAGHSVQVLDHENTFATSRRVQVHVGIRSEELTADEGVLFSHDVVETLDRNAEWAIGVEVVLPDGEMPSVATMGSDGRVVRVEVLPGAIFEPPTAVLDSFRTGSPGLRLVVVSPACFNEGWLPDGLEPRGREFRGGVGTLEAELVLRAAMVPRPLHVSGWDMVAGAPKPTSRMVPPGAVYCFERADGRPFGEDEVRALWLAALGARTGEGFGQVVPGTWSPTRRER